MDKIEEGILRLAVERGFVQHISGKKTLDQLIESGELSPDVVETLRNEVLDLMHTLADPLWSSARQTENNQEVSVAVFGRYIQLTLIGEGGMARVYRAYDPTLGRTVALKLLYKESERWMLEARNQAKVEHENVCKVYEVGEAEGRQYICMQYVDGMILSEAAQEMNLQMKVETMRKLADAIHAAHKEGLVHRDIKPGNIMLEKTADRNWKPYILDFGLARMQTAPGITLQGTVLGTPHYMPPEQARSENIDARSDVYSLGATFYELIAGHPPFSGSATEVIGKLLHQDPQPLRKIKPDTPVELETIVMKCLEKEPLARYQTARALAHDLNQFLEGEPIAARPVSWSGRMLKKAKKHRVISLLLATGAAVIVSLILLLLWTRWKANVQAEYAAEYSEEIRYIETMLLSTYTAPLHDVRPKLAIARQRLKRIAKRTAAGGSWAQGPGNNALGQGYLMLKDYGRAEEHLEKAWNSGYQNPSTAYALGKVKGIFWRQAMIDSNLLISKEMQEAARKTADEKYRKKAIQFLKTAREYAETPAYVEALILLYEKKYDEAFEKSSKAMEVSSRPYEVLKLQGDIHFQIGLDSALRADHKASFRSYDSAGDAYRRAAEIARSDQDIYLADAERWARTLSIQGYGDRQISFDEVMKACDRAIMIQPDNERPYLYKSEVYLQQGVGKTYTSGDPRPDFERAIGFAQEAAKRNPKNPATHERIASSFLRLAEFETANSMDPRKSLKQSIAESERALQLDAHLSSAYLWLAAAYFYLGDYELIHGANPTASLQKVIDIIENNLKTFQRDDYLFNVLGLAYLDLGEYKLKHGHDPRNELNHAIRAYESGVKLNPRAFAVYPNLGLAYMDIAKYEMAHGMNPEPSIRRAIEQYNLSLSISPDYAFAFHDRGVAFLLFAEHWLRTGHDPDEHLQQAHDSFAASMKLNPDLSFPHLSTSWIYFLKAKYLLENHQNPEKQFKFFDDWIARYFAKDQSHFEAYRARGSGALLKARWMMMRGKSPEVYFDSAVSDLQKANELTKNDLAVLRDLANIYRWKAAWQIAEKKDAVDTLEKAIKTLDTAEKLSPSDPETMAIRGAIKLLAAMDTQNTIQRGQYKNESAELLSKAMAENRFLKNEYEPIRIQAVNLK